MDIPKLKLILLVDDDRISNFITKTVIEETLTKGVKVCIAENGSEALALLRESIFRKIDIVFILLNLDMPVMNGFEFLNELSHIENIPELRIIIFSSSTSLRDQKQAMNYNVQGFISKPFTLEKLQQVLTLTSSHIQ